MPRYGHVRRVAGGVYPSGLAAACLPGVCYDVVSVRCGALFLSDVRCGAAFVRSGESGLSAGCFLPAFVLCVVPVGFGAVCPVLTGGIFSVAVSSAENVASLRRGILVRAARLVRAVCVPARPAPEYRRGVAAAESRCRFQRGVRPGRAVFGAYVQRIGHPALRIAFDAEDAPFGQSVHRDDAFDDARSAERMPEIGFQRVAGRAAQSWRDAAPGSPSRRCRASPCRGD